jgi:hypothetical protein
MMFYSRNFFAYFDMTVGGDSLGFDGAFHFVNLHLYKIILTF